ncbi:MAG TPA: hypothetical protein VH117_01645 [Edaphobacter sp.]|jgi:hypothetical protein|nr:hypothetical protein [Edaphobacter sp.]
MATAADAELILKLYELRQEEALRKARRFMVFEFNPKSLEELRAVSRDTKSEFNPYWRQAMSFWEMAASLVLRGGIDPDLFFDSSNEGILIYAKFHHWHAETEKQSGNPFMGQTAALIAKYPVAQARHEAFLKSFGLTK